ncbi:bis-aminopropyl spermidine synthase family protein [Nocardiopsis sp. NRRL B-16309]|uniref:bis-aminopropyl spermidine synthase family protein n=1 Tax=Nocardiopsis sp. NRRL B-16309 TaxID=1519494 RepID=UPI0006AF4A29|nr:bis-aminopropyl spermidine synthase family protein [Nocardiopsis sp. NRRL B-16309]KOX07223.1 methyltransferase [Nocardiopsis sp. NRRL B-16309]
MAGHPTSPGAAGSGAARTDDLPADATAPPLPAPAPPLPEAAYRLLYAHGVDAPRPRRVLALLSDGRWWSANDLVRASAVAHSVVAGLLRGLDEAGELVTEGGEGQGRVRLVRPADYRGASLDDLADPVAHMVPRHARNAAELARAVVEGPESDLDLDHVTATADTALRRALFLTTRFDLSDRTVLCVGDHDLTSVALALVCPSARTVVVDVDERVLAHIDALSASLGLPVRTHAADLRLGLPSTVRGVADVVFTDPPYTPDGVELFVRRGLEGMADPRRGRVLVAYGASEATPRLAATTQARLLRMDLLVESMWPDFNRYQAAESIGAASDLYVLRPLSRTPPGGTDEAARVYSQGVNAKEARGGLDAEAALGVAARAVEDQGGASVAGEPTLVGEWPAEVTRGGRVRLSTWMDSPAPAAGFAVVNLTGGWERLAARAALAATTDTVYVLVPSAAACVRDEAGQRALRAMLEPRFGVRFLRGFGRSDLTAVRLLRGPESDTASAVDRLLAHVKGRAHGTLTSTLRGGLVEVSAWLGRPVNKRTARHAVASAPGWVAGHSLLDLPEHRFAELRGVAQGLLAEIGEA